MNIFKIVIGKSFRNPTALFDSTNTIISPFDTTSDNASIAPAQIVS